MANQPLISVRMARATCLLKISLRPEDVAQILARAVKIDHIFSIAVALRAVSSG